MRTIVSNEGCRFAAFRMRLSVSGAMPASWAMALCFLPPTTAQAARQLS
jgi:hypothetical protein